MEWMEVCVSSVSETVEAIADIFYELGSGGVVIEDPSQLQDLAASGQWDAFELPEEAFTKTLPVVKGYLPFNEGYEAKLGKLISEVSGISKRMETKPAEISTRKVDQEDWANSWKKYFKPLRLGKRLIVRPTWEKYSPEEGEIVLDLDPGMAFGTGGHVTTAMMAAFLEKYIRPGMKVIDVGTGTGILAMFSSRLSAGRVLALDNDDVAVKVARGNIESNGLAGMIRVRQNDLLAGIQEKADLIVANIIADIIIKLFPQARECLGKEGLLLVSGIIGDRKEDVLKAGQRWGFELLEAKEEEDWVAQAWIVREC